MLKNQPFVQLKSNISDIGSVGQVFNLSLKQAEAIKNMVRPTARKELRRFIGMVNYYHDMWVRRSELLAPLTSTTSKNVNFIWMDEHQKAFDNIKKIICREVTSTQMQLINS
jgi:hypothetical protein